MKTQDFINRLHEEMEVIAEDHGYDLSDTYQSGEAFQLWYSSLVSAMEGGFSTVPEDAVLTTKDGGADIVLEDHTEKKLLIVQCKYRSLKKNNVEPSEQVNSFFKKHDDWLSDIFLSKLSNIAREKLSIYREAVKNKWQIELRYVTTALINDDRRSEVKTLQDRLNIDYISFDIVGRDELISYFSESMFAEEGIQDYVEINFKSDKIIKWSKPHDVVMGIVSGNELDRIYNRYRQSLYAYNIRHYLGQAGINKQIQISAEEEGENFFYFNNGISAICTELIIDKNKVKAKNFQIINGAQTVTSISKAKLEKMIDGQIKRTSKGDVEVLMRIVKSQSTKTVTSGFNEKIIRYNNTQNKISVSDFRSNDKVQIWLQNELQVSATNWGICQFYYQRKRSVQKPTGAKRRGKKVDLETLARIIYCFETPDFKPVILYDQSKRLWTPRSSDGIYEDIFGDPDDIWDKDKLERIKLAIGLFFEINNQLQDLEKNEKDILFVLRWWILALVGCAFRGNKISPTTTYKDANNFNKFMYTYEKAKKALLSVYNLIVFDDPSRDSDFDVKIMKKRDFNRSNNSYIQVRNIFMAMI